jgi:hypothetical protein
VARAVANNIADATSAANKRLNIYCILVVFPQLEYPRRVFAPEL